MTRHLREISSATSIIIISPPHTMTRMITILLVVYLYIDIYIYFIFFSKHLSLSFHMYVSFVYLCFLSYIFLLSPITACNAKTVGYIRIYMCLRYRHMTSADALAHRFKQKDSIDLSLKNHPFHFFGNFILSVPWISLCRPSSAPHFRVAFISYVLILQVCLYNSCKFKYHLWQPFGTVILVLR